MVTYWKLKSSSPFSTEYVYIDYEDNIAFSIFRDMKLRVKYKGELRHPNHSYHVLCVKVKNRDIKKFEDAMVILTNKLLVVSNHDYISICKEVDNIFQEES